MRLTKKIKRLFFRQKKTLFQTKIYIIGICIYTKKNPNICRNSLTFFPAHKPLSIRIKLNILNNKDLPFHHSKILKNFFQLITHSSINTKKAILKIHYSQPEKSFFISQLRIGSSSKHKNTAKSILETIEYCLSYSKRIVFFDHSLGGGTEYFFYNSLKELKDTHAIIRIQFFPKDTLFLLTAFSKNQTIKIADCSFTNILSIVHACEPTNIIINNLVGYKNIPETLKNIATFKSKAQITYMGHDYYAICPVYTLLNFNNIFCNIPDISHCIQCFPKSISKQRSAQNFFLSSNCRDIVSWKKFWNEFFTTTVDRLVVFSKSGKDIFTKAYPILQDKTDIVPHKVQHLRHVAIPPHHGVNIGVLGNIGSTAKGYLIVQDLVELCNLKQDIHIIIIGILPKGINASATGKYNQEELPNILEKNEIDVIFIPSICPETFSYTTAEAIEMNIPVACFNLGAPAERVKKYPLGIIIEETNAQCALKRILSYYNKE